MLPSGLIEYLKQPSSVNASLGDMDLLEEPYYSKFGSTEQSSSQSPRSVSIKERMRDRISTTLGHPLLNRAGSGVRAGMSPVDNVGVKAGGDGFPDEGGVENFRIMFHVMVQDHKLPDLIWNEQTRSELRNALENEIEGFEREQRLRGAGRVAWNYQQFHVRYDSLREELRVGSIYIRHFLETDDAFIRGLQNPSHGVLFEKLLRRILVNVEKNPPLSIMCTKCLCRLYRLCAKSVGRFDDMMITVRMLQQAHDMELQHALLDLLEQLTMDGLNLEQLLDKDFVRLGVRFSSLAHLNPDQIGNMLARSSTGMLALSNQAHSGVQDVPRPARERDVVGGMGLDGGTAGGRQDRKRSLWVPDDVSCPKCWFVAAREDCKGVLPPPDDVQKGPFLVSELVQMAESGALDPTACFVAPSIVEDYDEDVEAVVDTGRWRALADYFQLRMQVCSPGRAIYSPAEVAAKGLRMLRRLAALHHSVNSKNVPFFPIPESKRIMSDPDDLAVYAQLLLSNDARVVSIAADLLRTLLEFNVQANSKLYLSGAFFFGCRYTGNDIDALARLFYVTHLSQGFHDTLSAQQGIAHKSVLGAILPEALITMLENYGPERFATVFTGEFDTPEVIWSAAYRRHVVSMVDQHIGDFVARLRQFTLARYEYCPIPKIRFAGLESEIYCHEYYLRNLCDEARFKDWPIAQPLVLLREVIERWRQEMENGDSVDESVTEARHTLGLVDGDGDDPKKLRLVYRKLARKYHPDKNPHGREVFEKVHAAYELLAKLEHSSASAEVSMQNIVLIMKTQIIIYRRFPQAVRDQKYPSYRLLLDVLVPWSADESLDVRQLRDVGIKLVHFTCEVSPLNAKELVRAGGVAKLHAQLIEGLARYRASVSREGPMDGTTHGQAPQRAYSRSNSTEDAAAQQEVAAVVQTLTYTLRAMSAVCCFDQGRASLLEFCPAFPLAVVEVCKYAKGMPLAVEAALTIIARCAVSAELQVHFVAAGSLTRLIPMLTAFDVTLGMAFQEESGRAVYNQHASNCHGVGAATALAHLGGYDDEAPANMPVRTALERLLTQPIAKLLRLPDPLELLKALNENVERANKIWNVGMRQELLSFVNFADGEFEQALAAGTLDSHDNLALSETFTFSALLGELCVGGIYVRIFVKDASITDVDAPSAFCTDLCAYMWSFLATSADADDFSAVPTPPTPMTVSVQDRDLAFEAMRILVDMLDSIAVDLMASPYSLPSLLSALCDRATSTDARLSVARCLARLCKESVFVDALCAHEPPLAWRLLHCLCSDALVSDSDGEESLSSSSSSVTQTAHSSSLNNLDGSATGQLWMATDGLAATQPGHAALLTAGAMVHLLGCILNLPGYSKAYQNRVMAVSLLATMLAHPMSGPEAADLLHRFLPEPLITMVKTLAAKAALEQLDRTVETPEVIWTADMKAEMRREVLALATGLSRDKSHHTAAGRESLIPEDTNARVDFRRRIVICPDFRVVYDQLESEVYIGGVYIRLFLKQPTFRLTHPVLFLEKLSEFWGASFDSQVPPGTGKGGRNDDSSSSSSNKEVDGAALGLGLGGSSFGGAMPTNAKQTALVLSKEDFLSLITSCMVCVVRAEITLVSHLLSWGFARNLCARLKQAIDLGRVGSPVTSIARILHQMLLSSGPETADELAQAPVNLLVQLVRVLDPRTAEEAHRLKQQQMLMVEQKRVEAERIRRLQPRPGPVSVGSGAAAPSSATSAAEPLPAPTIARLGLENPLPKESALLVEVTRLLFQKAGNRRAQGFLVHLALTAGLPTALLNILSASAELRANVRAPQTLTVYAVETLKSMVNGCDATNAALLNEMLQGDAAWDEFRGQSHDLYITQAGAKGADQFLLHDAAHDTLSRLLTYDASATATATATAGAEYKKPPPTKQQQPNHMQKQQQFAPTPAPAPAPVVNAHHHAPSTPADLPPPPTSATKAESAPSPPVVSPEVEDMNEWGAFVREGIMLLRTTIVRGQHGIGIDLGKNRIKEAVVQKLKDMPDGSANPALVCQPSLEKGDRIVGVNGAKCELFEDVVTAIKGGLTTSSTLHLLFLRQA